MNNLPSILSAITIKYHSKVQPYKRPRVQTSQQAYMECLKFFAASMMNVREEAVVLFLNSRGRVLGGFKVSSGEIKNTVVDWNFYYR